VPNNRTETSPAITPRFRSGTSWRGVVYPKRSAAAHSTMKRCQTRLVVLAGIVALTGGCDRVLSTSGVPTTLDTDALILAAGSPQGVKLSNIGERGRSHRERSLETEREFHATLTSGTRGHFLAEYRTQVKRAIEAAGATIDGAGLSGTEGDVVNFSYDYVWHGNAGIFRVYSFDGTNGEVQVVSLSYEHRQ
jgi:hypothetical protein